MKKNIAIIVPKLTGGGAEKVASNLSMSLNQRNNAHIIVYDDKNITYEYSGKLLSINDKKKNTIIGKVFALIKRINSVRKIKKQYEIKTSISFMENPNFVNILSAVKDKIIVSVRIYKSDTPNDFFGRLNKLFMRILYNKADYIVAVSEVIKEDLIRNFNIEKNKIKVIYNPYDVKKINELGNEPLESEFTDFFKGKVITNMGRLEIQKGQKFLIRAFAKVKKEVPDAKLLIFGGGTLENELKKLVQELDLSNDVRFIGYATNPFKYIKRSDLFVFPSLYEGFPNALCEAMACGTPVISSDCKSGPREILYANANTSEVVKEIEFADYGVLVPLIKNSPNIHDINSLEYENYLKEAIVAMLQDEEKCKEFSVKALDRVADFSVGSTTKKWEEIML